ncbi:hypothetical protein Tsubulata_014576 [Turnera subulata]|uniref:Uncharacterized protein n=1 Tax=Turnera subulata TaxID=218843 RepID=A0A9Q0GC35_9ROSI|nr:hypothetical protein Tsubulata_014576 [Turnera subulata]
MSSTIEGMLRSAPGVCLYHQKLLKGKYVDTGDFLGGENCSFFPRLRSWAGRAHGICCHKDTNIIINGFINSKPRRRNAPLCTQAQLLSTPVSDPTPPTTKKV